jgi:hypothetical protein
LKTLLPKSQNLIPLTPPPFPFLAQPALQPNRQTPRSPPSLAGRSCLAQLARAAGPAAAWSSKPRQPASAPGAADGWGPVVIPIP